MRLKELSGLLYKAVDNGAKNALALNHCLTGYITKANAYRLYGRSNVDRWFSEGLLNPAEIHGKNSLTLIYITELERVAAASNRMTYLPVAER